MARFLVLLLAVGLLAATFTEAAKKAQKKEAVDPAKAEEASTEENQDESENKPALDQEAKDVKDKAESAATGDAQQQPEEENAEAKEKTEDQEDQEDQQAQKSAADAAKDDVKAADKPAEHDAEATVADAEEKDSESQAEEPEAEAPKAAAAPEQDKDSEATDKEAEDEEESTKNDDVQEVKKEEKKKAFECNLKFQKVGCYKDNGKKLRPLSNFIMKDVKISSLEKKSSTSKASTLDSNLPSFACRCANEAIERGNAIFGLQDFANCWSGTDDSKYDKDGKADDCVSFGLQKCKDDDELCVGKAASNFVYFINTPEHTKSQEEAKKEWAAIRKAEAERKRKSAKARKEAKAKKGKKQKLGKKEKKSKKHGKKHA